MPKQLTVLEQVRKELTGNWLTLWQLQDKLCVNHNTMISESAVGARVRELRSARCGAITVQKRPTKGNAWEYRIGRAA